MYSIGCNDSSSADSIYEENHAVKNMFSFTYTNTVWTGANKFLKNTADTNTPNLFVGFSNLNIDGATFENDEIKTTYM